MNKTKVIPILTGTAQVFILIKDGKMGMVDAGNRNTYPKIEKALQSRGINIEDLDFVFLTHTHFDHAGNAAELKDKTGAEIIVHESEADYLSKGFHPIPGGKNWFISWISRLGRTYTAQQFSAYAAVEPDILFSNNFNIRHLGFDAELLHTPGHTEGSSVLVLENKAFVGDTLFNMHGFKYPLFVNDQESLMESWKILADLKVEYYYPAHGKRIKKTELESLFRKYSKK